MAKINTSTMETRTLTEGKSVAIQVREKFLDAGWLLNVRGSLDVTGGTGDGSILSHAVARLLRRIEVRGGAGARVSLRGLSLAALNRLLERGGYEQTNPASLAAAASDDFSGWFRIPFAMPHSDDPYAFNFNTMGVSAPTLFLDIGTAEDMTDGQEDATGLALSGFEVEVVEEALMEPEKIGRSRLVIRQTYIDVETTATGRKVYLDELGLGAELRGVLIEAMSGGNGESGFVYDNGVVTSVALVVDGGYAVEPTSFNVLRQRNRNAYQLASTETGLVLLDSAEDRNTLPGQLWTIRRAQRPYLELDLSPQGAGDNRVWITYLVAER